MDTQHIIELIKQKGQRITEQRIALLQWLIEQKKACALAELETALAPVMDRATMYRSLKLFLAAGLILKVRDQEGAPMYVFSSEETHSEASVHPHLKCTRCDSLECLPALPAEYLSRLEEYQIDELQIVLDGVCSNCSPAKK